MAKYGSKKQGGSKIESAERDEPSGSFFTP